MSSQPDVVARYRGPDTSDKRDDESWLEYWDRRRIELHGRPWFECKCLVCRLHAFGIGDEGPRDA